jgi:erlin
VNRLEESLVIPTIRNYTGEYDKIWIYDKIHHEINQYCSKHTLKQIFIDNFSDIDEELIFQLKKTIDKYAPGINIISVRVTKPEIPLSIK